MYLRSGEWPISQSTNEVGCTGLDFQTWDSICIELPSLGAHWQIGEEVCETRIGEKKA